VEVNGVTREGVFEIFPSGNSWALLFGKPLMKTFGMVHRYDNDTISFDGPSGQVTINNELGQTRDALSAEAAGVSLTSDIKQHKALKGDTNSPSRRVSLPQFTTGTKL
jgi:hypothetical protein